MAHKGDSSPTQDERFHKVLAEILRAEEEGTPLDRSKIVRAYPELEGPLREYFQDRDGFDRLASALAPTFSHGAVPPEPAPGSRFGGYEIVRELGRGGMGVVYLARQLNPKRLVALKLIRLDRLAHLPPRQRAQWLARFRVEGQAAARLSGDNVVPVYEVGTHDGQPFYAMQFVQGRSLAVVLEGGALPNRAVARVMERVARAVQTIHDQGVLHRDLKPHNILVDGRGRPYVCDFGLAKSAHDAESLTNTGDVLGSLEYMSPEQLDDAARVDEATDVYGLGATLYALLTGRPPFQGKPAAVVDQVKRREPVPPRRLNPVVDLDLNTIALKCLQKEPGARFGSAGEVADELQCYLDCRPIRSRPIGPTGRLWLWCRRNPAFASVSAAAMVLLTLAGGLYWAYASSSQKKEELVQAVGELNTDLGAAREDNEATGKKAAVLDKQVQAKEATIQRITGINVQLTEDKQATAYLKDMRMAQQLVEAKENAKTRELLAHWQTSPQRAWEWDFLDAECRDAGFPAQGQVNQKPAATQLPGFSKPQAHNSQVLAVAWSWDGTRLASADGDGVVWVWDVATGKRLPKLTVKGGVAALAWRPDGKRLAAVSAEPSQSAFAPFAAIPPPAVPASPRTPMARGPAHGHRPGRTRGRTSVTNKSSAGAHHASVVIWDMDTRKVWHTLRRTANVGPALALPPKPGEPMVDQTFFLGSWSLSLLWSPDGKKLALADDGGNIQTWQVSTGKTHVLPKAHPGGVHSIAWSPDSRWLASIGGDRQVKVWDLSARKPTEPVHTWPVQSGDRLMPTPGYALTWSKDGKSLHVVSGRGQICVLDASTGSRAVPITQLVTHDRSARMGIGPLGTNRARFLWSADGSQLAGVESNAAFGPRVRVWDPATGAEGISIAIPGFKPGLVAAMCAPAWDPAGQRLAMGGKDGTVQAVPIQAVSVRSPRQPVRQLRGLAWAADSRHVLGLPDLAVAQAEYLKAEQERMQPALDALKRAAATGGLTPPDPNAILQPRKGGPGGAVPSVPRCVIEICDATTGAIVRKLSGTVPLGAERPDVLNESPNGQWLASATRSGVILLWSLAGGAPYVVEKPPDAKTAPGDAAAPFGRLSDRTVLGWSPDSKWLAYSTAQQTTIRLWDPISRKVCSLAGHGQPLRALAWSRDSKWLASAGEDGTVKIWDVANQRQQSPELEYVARRDANAGMASPSRASMLAWSRDGKWLAIAGDDETVKIWQVGTDKVIVNYPHPSSFDIHETICALAWSPDGKRLASASPDGTFLLWNTTTWDLILALKREPGGASHQRPTPPGGGGTLAWSPDGRQLAYFRGCGIATIWDARP